MWHSNPAWWALIISSVALITSGFALIQRGQHYHGEKTKRRSEILRGLSNQANVINEGFIRLDITGPYAHHLNIPKDQVKKFSSKATMLLYQINMLRDVHQNREIIGESELEIYGDWASTIVRPWIEEDEDLKRAWFLSKEAEDLRDPLFSKWLNHLFPIIRSQ